MPWTEAHKLNIEKARRQREVRDNFRTNEPKPGECCCGGFAPFDGVSEPKQGHLPECCFFKDGAAK